MNKQLNFSQQKIIQFMVVVSLLLLAIGLVYLPINSFANHLFNKPTLHGFQTEFRLSDIDMINDEGLAISSAELQQKPFYLTTGFTTCNHSCPVTMGFIAQLKQALPSDVNYAMLTIDPLVDTPERLDEFLHKFDEDIIGLRVDEAEQMRNVIADLKLNIGYAGQDITHTDYVYLFHPKLDGMVIYANFNKEQMVNDFLVLAQYEGKK